MNKNILFLFFLVCSVYSLGQNSAYITFDSLTINYGKILQGDNGTVDFKFTNTGDRDLKINKVRSSCGCTIPKKPDSLIAPGVSDLIKVTGISEKMAWQEIAIFNGLQINMLQKAIIGLQKAVLNLSNTLDDLADET